MGAPSGVVRPEPVSVIRPPSIARVGWTAVACGMPNMVHAGRRGRFAADFELWSAVDFEFRVPVQVVAPALGGVAESDADPHRRRMIGTLRMPEQVHAGLI